MDTKKTLACALIECMDSKPLDKIRVEELAAKAGVSKQTFYRHFNDKYDLLDFCFLHLFDEPLGMIAAQEDFRACLRVYFTLCKQNECFMRNALKSNDINSLFTSMFRGIRAACGARVVGQGGVDEGDTWFVLECYAKSIRGMTRHWLGSGAFVPQEERTVEELVELAIKCLPKMLIPYFE